MYQINEGGASFRDATFARADEIWRSTLLTTPQQQWLLTDSLTATAEPEPFVETSRVWVFYNVIEGDNPLTATWRGTSTVPKHRSDNHCVVGMRVIARCPIVL